jgi:hypothetical protein
LRRGNNFFISTKWIDKGEGEGEGGGQNKRGREEAIGVKADN